MAPHSSTFASKIPWTEEPGGLQSMGCQCLTPLLKDSASDSLKSQKVLSVRHA